MTQATQAYRALLRAVRRHVTSSRGNTEFESFAARRFKELARTGGDPALAQDYALLINSVKDHKDLLLSYSIGIDPEQRQKDMYERAAARVGLELPPQLR